MGPSVQVGSRDVRLRGLLYLSLSQTLSRLAVDRESDDDRAQMRDLCRLIGWMVVDLIRSRVMLEAEIWTLRQQINVLRRTAPKKLSFCAVDRMIFVGHSIVYFPTERYSS